MKTGIGVAPGIAIGKALVIREPELKLDQSSVPQDQSTAELERFLHAVAAVSGQLDALITKAQEDMAIQAAEIFQAYRMVLDDDILLDEIKGEILEQNCHAEYAAYKVISRYVDLFRAMTDEHLRERAADLQDIGNRLVKAMLGIPVVDLGLLQEPVIVVAHDLSPSDTIKMDLRMVLAFVTEIGGKTSHTALMAKAMKLPSVIGLGPILEEICDGDLLVVDGQEGTVWINPPEDVLVSSRTRKDQYNKQQLELASLRNLPASTADGLRTVELVANVGGPKECAAALEQGAQGIGLFRSEFLFMNRSDFPSEEEQLAAYRNAVLIMNGRPVTIRTLDVGGDKKLPYLNLGEELNPFLGYRAIRFCLDRPDWFKVQLRAILRASAAGKVRILYPMISSLSEVQKANRLLEEAKEELRAKNCPFDENLEVGIMIEIPAAAMTADLLIREVDFFSIGTNDLIQYTVAADRMNEKVADLYQPLHPAVLRLIQHTIDASHRAGKWTGMCGEMAGDPHTTAILLGLGLDEFSMSAVSIPCIKHTIRGLTMSQAGQAAREALQLN